MQILAECDADLDELAATIIPRMLSHDYNAFPRTEQKRIADAYSHFAECASCRKGYQTAKTLVLTDLAQCIPEALREAGPRLLKNEVAVASRLEEF